MRGIEAQFLALQKGFNELIPQHLLKPFDQKELEVSARRPPQAPRQAGPWQSLVPWAWWGRRLRAPELPCTQFCLCPSQQLMIEPAGIVPGVCALGFWDL